MSDSLTPKQERFVNEWVKTGNKSEAYRIAYDAENMADSTITEKACLTSQKGNVRAMYEKLQKAAQKRNEIDIDTISGMFVDAHQVARESNQPSAMVSAASGLAKLHGLNKPDKLETTGKDGADLVPKQRTVIYVKPE